MIQILKGYGKIELQEYLSYSSAYKSISFKITQMSNREQVIKIVMVHPYNETYFIQNTNNHST